MEYNRPIILSIAGFDPTGGAGLLADIKTFEQHKCLGFGVMTSNTIQTENYFIATNWVCFEQIILQLQPLFDNYKIDFVKIGMIENLQTLFLLTTWLKQKKSEIKIVWDTVLASSSGYTLIQDLDKNKLVEILKNCYLITPNFNEIKLLSGIENGEDGAKYLSEFCKIYLKGGHNIAEIGTDYLFENGHAFSIKTDKDKLSPKHGSGCVLSAALLSQLALNQTLKDACNYAKIYVEKLLESNSELLGYHVQ